ncbi:MULTISPECIES: hypothetical protein [Streptomyces]|uniref:Uncharacterized protein n=1 Tax=Streptomyces anthocyanicus TaxID=68174 RepID=A0ABZ1LQY1_9ACTN|nr:MULTISPECIES: hypothetical protein [Streptomyces]MDX3322943.1 hypothetical protein [Streptomyces sp. ME03-5684b]MDX3347222.1 hypothetical protein [Streptomyces sp. ME02-6979A]WSB64849.1 hypothetical protein OIE72_33290 [Streptomyces anthocyanicus]WTE22465.1 hypothetical protein OH747_34625 [Streptomyces anthocyanicus]
MLGYQFAVQSGDAGASLGEASLQVGFLSDPCSSSSVELKAQKSPRELPLPMQAVSALSRARSCGARIGGPTVGDLPVISGIFCAPSVGRLDRCSVKGSRVGAPESNAGDDFHFWWAASRALKLVEPGTILRRVTLEGLAHVDDPDDEYETVDVAEYLGGDDADSADALVLSQLKYSSRHPDTEWTTARLCKKSVRYRANGTTTPARSVIADLAAVYRRLVDEHGVDVASKARIALVSNQSAAPELVSSVAAATAWVADQGQAVQTRALLAALPAEQAATVRSLSEAVGARLSSQQFCGFMGALDLSQTGAMDRAALARAVQSGAAELTPGKGHDSALKLFHLVRAQALPDSNRKGVAASDVLAELVLQRCLP